MKDPREKPSLTAARLGSGQRILFSLALLAVLVALLEGVLRLPWIRDRVGVAQSIGGFGAGGSLFVPIALPDGRPGLSVRPGAIHTFRIETMLARKPAGALRVFCLGESSTFGYPWGKETAFPKDLERRIHALMPDLPVEVLNLGAMSYGSLRIRNLVEELVRYEPDLFVLYVGHNEFVEEEVYREILSESGWLASAARDLSNLKTYSLLQMGARSLFGEPRQNKLALGVGAAEELNVMRAERKLFTLEEKDRIAAAFCRNMEEIIDTAERHGAKVLLLTMPSNLRDWRPEHLAYAYPLEPERRKRLMTALAVGRAFLQKSSLADAAEVFELAVQADPRYAPAHYDLARSYDKLGRIEEAKRQYLLARDLDPVPIRALTSVNDAIRAIARDRKSVLFSDAEDDFASASPGGIIGSNLILDYCHPNFEGHARIATLIARTLAARATIASTARWGVERLDRLSFPEETPRRESDEPTEVLWWLGIVATRQGRDDDAIENFKLAVGKNARFAPAWKQLGGMYNKRGNLEEARRCFEKAAAADPADLEPAFQLAVLQRQRGDAAGSVLALKRLVQVDPNNADFRTKLGESQYEAKEYEDSLHTFREAIRLAPDYYSPYQGMAMSYKALGKREEAKAALRKAIEIVHYLPSAEQMLRELEEEEKEGVEARPAP